MIISEQIAHLRNSIVKLRQDKLTAIVGFVPTMGALHDGHLALIEKAKLQSDIVVVSIFVNPTQFNDSEDLKKYPRTIETDIIKLKSLGCDILFTPAEKEIYPDKKEKIKIDLNGLDQLMEGKFRKGHFDGVAMVVARLFAIVEPDKAYFGLKDFQQLAIIKQMVKFLKLKVDIIGIDIVRSASGLALSSRNELLSSEEKEEALVLFQCLKLGKALVSQGNTPFQVSAIMKDFISKSQLELEYIEIVDQDTLENVSEFRQGIFCCVAAFCGKVRLIDNMQFS